MIQVSATRKIDLLFGIMLACLLTIGCINMYRIILNDRRDHAMHGQVGEHPALVITVDSLHGIVCYNWPNSNALSCARER